MNNGTCSSNVGFFDLLDLLLCRLISFYSIILDYTIDNSRLPRFMLIFGFLVGATCSCSQNQIEVAIESRTRMPAS